MRNRLFLSIVGAEGDRIEVEAFPADNTQDGLDNSPDQVVLEDGSEVQTNDRKFLVSIVEIKPNRTGSNRHIKALSNRIAYLKKKLADPNGFSPKAVPYIKHELEAVEWALRYAMARRIDLLERSR